MYENSTEWQEGIAAYEEKDYRKALELLLPFAEQGIPEAQCVVGSIYHTGIGVGVNGPEAVKWYVRAGQQGHPLAYNNLACIYTTGLPEIAIDVEKARECHRKAAELGFEMWDE